MTNDIEIMKKQIKENIKLLINDNRLDEAINLIEEYKKIDLKDKEIYSIEAVVLIIKKNLAEAEKVLKKGLVIDEENFDLNYNLGYIYEQEKKFIDAVKYYKKAIDNCNDYTLKMEIANLVEKITYEHKINPIQDKKKMAFFVKQGMDSFLRDIIDRLSDEYEIKKIVVTDSKHIDIGMEWAEICWFEWCDELIAYGSKHNHANNKKIICRLHRYEALTDYPKNVDWNNVDKLIVVADHLKEFLLSQIPDIEKKVNIITINNGVNLNKYEFKERYLGFNIAYVGYIHQRKNPVLLLQIISKLVKIDNRYKLYIAGQFQDGLIELYWNYQIQQMGLHKNVIFEGWQENISKWLEDKNYILSSSIHESFGYGIAEAMARGVKPVIHNFVFAEEIWDKKYLFNTVDEAVNCIVDKKYNSSEYRKFIQDNYSLNDQIEAIKKVLSSLYLQSVKQNQIDLIYIISKYIEFSPYTNKEIDLYNFEDNSISIGKIEQLTNKFSLIEFIIKNKEGEQLVLQNIWYDIRYKRVILPQYILHSKNKEKIMSLINTIISYKLEYNGSIAGFINDYNILNDVKKNELVYVWERGIPGTQFMPCFGYLRIIQRYIFASMFIKETDQILEAASGFGYGAAYFSKICKKVYALDLASENIKFGKSTYKNNNIEWVNGDVTKLPFDDNKFNFYSSFETFEHLPLNLIDKYFEEALRVLKKEGSMILSTPNREMRKHINNPFHIKEYNFHELDMILKKYFKNIRYYSVVGFEVEEGCNKNAENIIVICSNSDINIYKKYTEKEKLYNIEARFMINPDDVQNTEKYFEYLLEIGDEERYIKYQQKL